MLIESPVEMDAGWQGTFENMLRASVASGILLVDSGDKISAITAEAERTLKAVQPGFPKQLEELPETLRHIIREVQQSQSAVVNRHMNLCGSAGSVPVVVNAARSVSDARGVVVAIKRDNSSDEMEQNLRRLDRLASVGTLSASMAHEIKNALVAVRTFTDLLLEKNSDSDLASIVRREVGRVDSIVSQMLRFAAPAQPRFSSIALHKVLDHCVRLVQHGKRHKQIAFKSEFSATPDALIGDDHQLEQAFVNLLFNAVESIESEGILSVSTDLVPDVGSGELREEASPKQWLRIRISDTGAGIPADKLGHIFEPFFTTKQTGTGLGLAVTRRIVRQHHGKIHVESVVGKGTTFIVLLPAGPSAS